MKITNNPLLGTWEMAENGRKSKKRDQAIRDNQILCDDIRIMIVDDEPAIRKVFQRILAAELPEHQLDLACDGQEALEQFKGNHHSVILMDLSMPIMNGEEAFNEMMAHCKSEKWEEPSIVFCTGFDPSNIVRNIVSADPAHCMLRKPVSNKTIVDAIKARIV